MAAVTEDSKVKYSFLGKTGVQVSNICLGALTFGEMNGWPGQCDETLAHSILDRYMEWGGNFIDTSNTYGRGGSELMVGSWLERQHRHDVVVATKCGINMGRTINSRGLSRRHITESLEGSLERLRTHYVDIYQTHIFDNATLVEETYRTLDDLVRCGKVRYVGVSNVTGWQLQKIVETQKHLGLNPIVSVQQQYNLACRTSELEAFQVCKNEGISVLPWSPLKGGLLAGRVRRGQKPTEGRLGWVAHSQTRKGEAHPHWEDTSDQIFDLIELAIEIGKKHGRTIAQVAIRWLLQKDVTSSVIIGARTLQQLDQNMAVNDWALSADEMKQLDDASATAGTYPYVFIDSLNAGRTNANTGDYYVKSVAA